MGVETRVTANMTADQKQTIEDAAYAKRIPVSRYVREVMLADAQTYLAKRARAIEVLGRKAPAPKARRKDKSNG